MTSAITFRHRLWLGIALGHLALVFLGAAYFDTDKLGRLGSPLHYYGLASGSGNSYGFFAPGVYTQLRARFEVTDRRGRTRLLPLVTGASKEADLRVGNIIDQFIPEDAEDTELDERLQRSLSASLARGFFTRDAGVRKVKVRLEQYTAVSMDEYLQGRRGAWAPIYTADYSLHSRKARP